MGCCDEQQPITFEIYFYTNLKEHETSINTGFTKDHENLVCEFHVTFKKQLFTHEI